MAFVGQKAKELATLALGKDEEQEKLLRLTEKLSIIFQIENLMTYPCVRDKVSKGELHILAGCTISKLAKLNITTLAEHDFLALKK